MRSMYDRSPTPRYSDPSRDFPRPLSQFTIVVDPYPYESDGVRLGIVVAVGTVGGPFVLGFPFPGPLVTQTRESEGSTVTLRSN